MPFVKRKLIYCTTINGLNSLGGRDMLAFKFATELLGMFATRQNMQYG